jgi:hypothetical protein
MEHTQNKKFIPLVVGIIILIIVSGVLWFILPHEPKFCFTFAPNTQFGEKKDFTDYPNNGFDGPRGMTYFLPETNALQTALKKEGFYIDELEETGGGVYLAAFYGPTTQTAVRDFQKKYGLEQTGIVGNDMLEKLNEKYACPPSSAGTASTTYSISTTTIE